MRTNLALHQIGGIAVVGSLVRAAKDGKDWIAATLGRMQPGVVAEAVAGTELEARLTAFFLLNETTDWLSTGDRVMDLALLDKQNI